MLHIQIMHKTHSKKGPQSHVLLTFHKHHRNHALDGIQLKGSSKTKGPSFNLIDMLNQVQHGQIIKNNPATSLETAAYINHAWVFVC